MSKISEKLPGPGFELLPPKTTSWLTPSADVTRPQPSSFRPSGRSGSDDQELENGSWTKNLYSISAAGDFSTAALRHSIPTSYFIYVRVFLPNFCKSGGSNPDPLGCTLKSDSFTNAVHVLAFMVAVMIVQCANGERPKYSLWDGNYVGWQLCRMATM